MHPGPPRRRRARPVADAPVDALLQREQELAKGWLIGLIEEAAIDDVPAIHAGELLRDGPRICAAVARALVDDRALQQLEPGGRWEEAISSIGELVGAGGVEGASRAVDILHEVIWTALREELSRPDADQVAELSERLGLVIRYVRAAALGGAQEVPRRTGAPSLAAVGSEPSSEEQAADRRWTRALAGEIERGRRSASALSLLLVELQEAERIIAAEPDDQASAIFDQFANALRAVVRPHDALITETAARVWIIARDTERGAAQTLAARAAQAVRDAPSWRGAPLTVSIGIALLGEDGQDPASLIEAAEQATLAGSASGVEVSHAQRAADDADPPSGTGPRLVS